MFGLGFTELLFIGFLALILIGPEDLPRAARTLGRFLNELKSGSDSFKAEFRKSTQEFNEEIRIDPTYLSQTAAHDPSANHHPHNDLKPQPMDTTTVTGVTPGDPSLTQTVDAVQVAAVVPVNSLETEAVPSNVSPPEGKRNE